MYPEPTDAWDCQLCLCFSQNEVLASFVTSSWTSAFAFCLGHAEENLRLREETISRRKRRFSVRSLN